MPRGVAPGAAQRRIGQHCAPQHALAQSSPSYNKFFRRARPCATQVKKNPGLAELHIKVPEEGGDDSWGFRGQVIQLSADLMQSVKSLKEKLSGILGGMPVQKMKFKTNLHSVLKDNETLASYNIASGNILELSVKERGGRRKL